MNTVTRLSIAAAAWCSCHAALANPLVPPTNQVSEPGMLSLVGIAVAAAVWFGKRGK